MTGLLYNGHYEYNEKIFTDRESVLDYMVVSGERDSRLRYVFHDDVFSSIDWHHEPEFDLEWLYILRARQLRETYDYLILSYSGGSDSHEVLKTFIENDIFLDEVQIVHHEKAINKLDPSEHENLEMFDEYKRNVIPSLDDIKKKSPHTKITLLDATDYLIDETIGNNYHIFGHVNNISITRTPVTRFSRTNFAFQHKHNEKTLSGRKNVCLIQGNDKPFLTASDGILYCYFSDSLLQGVKYINRGIISNIYTIEEFFCSPHAPLIPIKQSHVLLKVMNLYSVFKKSFISYVNTDKYSNNNKIRFEFNRSYVPYIYKYWDRSKIFFPKPIGKSHEFALISKLFETDKPFDAAKEYNKHTLSRYKDINHRYIYRPLFSKMYSIGRIGRNER
jgi:hypothetical protein